MLRPYHVQQSLEPKVKQTFKKRRGQSTIRELQGFLNKGNALGNAEVRSHCLLEF